MDKKINDSISGGWVELMPARARPYLRLSRYDRPIGFWLLALPGWIGLLFASFGTKLNGQDLHYALLIAVGAIAMRGAGCTYNDIIDRDLDAQVKRTAGRPLAAGTIGLRQAWLWLAAQCAAGLLVLLFFAPLAQIVAVSSLVLVAAYPFMKRIIQAPQIWLGLTFNWAVLVAYTAKAGQLSPELFWLYFGLVFWTIGYDTIYACQDKEDDALVGIKSTARFFGEKTKIWTGAAYGLSALLISIACALALGTPWGGGAGLAFAAHLAWQIRKFDPDNGGLCLALFRANRVAAFLLILGMMIAKLLLFVTG